MSRAGSETLTGQRRAAILMVLLGDEAGGALLKQLPTDQVAAIVTELAEVGEIDAELGRKVLEDYFVDATRPERQRGGTDFIRRLLERAEIPEAERGRLVGSTDPARELLGPLLATPPKQLAAILEGEHPQTGALVLLNLSPEIAGQVLRNMPEDSRSETVMRMAALRKVGGEMLGEVASSLQERLRNQPPVEQQTGDGLARTAAVLQCMGRGEARDLLGSLEREDPERATALRNLIYSFDSLALVDDRGIQELLRLVDTKLIAVALHGEDEALAQKILENLSARAGSMLREEMEFLGTVRPDEKQAAQKELIDQALKLEQEGKLTFTEPKQEKAEA